MGRNKKVTKEQIEKLMEDGYNKYEIADILDISKSTISKRLREGKEGKPKATDEQILELKRSGKLNKEIASILHVSEGAISQRISKMDKDKVAEATKQGKKVREMEDKTLDLELDKELTEQIKEQQRELKIKLQEKTISRKDIQQYKEALSKKQRITNEDINLMIKICIKTGQIHTAIQCIDIAISKTPIVKKTEIEKLEEMKNKVKSIGKEQEIRRLLKGKVKTSAIAEQVGIPETEVIQIKHKIEQSQGIEM